MDCEEKALQSFLPQLVVRLKADDVIDKLRKADLLTQREYERHCEEVSHNSDQRSINRKILIALRRGPKGSIAKFEQILRESQPDLAGELAGELRRGEDHKYSSLHSFIFVE